MDVIKVERLKWQHDRFKISCESEKLKIDHEVEVGDGAEGFDIWIPNSTKEGKALPIIEAYVPALSPRRGFLRIQVDGREAEYNLYVDDTKWGRTGWTLPPRTHIPDADEPESRLQRAMDCPSSLRGTQRTERNKPTYDWEFRWREILEDPVPRTVLEMNTSPDRRNWQQVGERKENWDAFECNISLNLDLGMEVAQAAGIWAVAALYKKSTYFSWLKESVEEHMKLFRSMAKEMALVRQQQRESEEAARRWLARESGPTPLMKNDALGEKGEYLSCVENEKDGNLSCVEDEKAGYISCAEDEKSEST